MTHVLVVEDSETVSEFLRWALSVEGLHTVTIAIHNRALLTNPSDSRWDGIDVLMTDLMMPDVSGIEILQTAKTHHPHIRRLCLTGVEDEGATLLAARALADKVLQKPSQMDEILAAVADG